MIKWNEISPFTGRDIEEDAPTNSAGSGSVAGLGVGPMGEPGVKKKKKKRTLIDARFKAYREHRARLEASRLKRQEAIAKRGKFTESIVSEMTYSVGSMGFIRPQADMSNKDMVNAAKKKKSKIKKKSSSDEKNN